MYNDENKLNTDDYYDFPDIDEYDDEADHVGMPDVFSNKYDIIFGIIVITMICVCCAGIVAIGYSVIQVIIKFLINIISVIFIEGN